MDIPYNGRDNDPTRHFMLPNKTLHIRNGSHFFFESLAKGVPRTLQTLQASPNVIDYPPQYDSKALLLKISLTYVIKHQEIKLGPN